MQMVSKEFLGELVLGSITPIKSRYTCKLLYYAAVSYVAVWIDQIALAQRHASAYCVIDVSFSAQFQSIHSGALKHGASLYANTI